MANRVRGEFDAEIGGKAYTLTLGLGALAELEDAFGVESFEDALPKVLAGKVSAKALRSFTLAVLRGNGHTGQDVEKAVARMAVSDFMELVTGLLEVSGIIQKDAPASAAPEDERPLGDQTAGRSG